MSKMRVLMVGNSLTTSNDMPSMLGELLDAEVLVAARGGARLSEFANPETRMGERVAEALKEPWDYVILQDMSHNAASSPEAHVRSVARMAELVREAGATPILYGTWGYAKTCPKLEKLGFTYDEMYDLMCDGAAEAAKLAGIVVADVATAFHEADKPEKLYAPDGVHPSGAGSLLAAQVLARACGR